MSLNFDGVDPELELEPWEPIFPTRRKKCLPGEPAGAHIFRAFDNLPPKNVRCVVLGQDPYPCPAFSTGRAFEAGNTASWGELDKMFSKSVRTLIQLIVAARTGCSSYASDFEEWANLLSEIESGRVELEAPSDLADRWVASGTLLVNSSLTITRFQVDGDPHQSKGHLPLWRPLLTAVLRYLASRGTPTVFIGFGEVAAQTIRCAGLSKGKCRRIVSCPHPAFAEELLGAENPFLLCNAHLAEMGETPIDW